MPHLDPGDDTGEDEFDIAEPLPMMGFGGDHEPVYDGQGPIFAKIDDPECTKCCLVCLPHYSEDGLFFVQINQTAFRAHVKSTEEPRGMHAWLFATIGVTGTPGTLVYWRWYKDIVPDQSVPTAVEVPNTCQIPMIGHDTCEWEAGPNEPMFSDIEEIAGPARTGMRLIVWPIPGREFDIENLERFEDALGCQSDQLEYTYLNEIMLNRGFTDPSTKMSELPQWRLWHERWCTSGSTRTVPHDNCSSPTRESYEGAMRRVGANNTWGNYNASGSSLPAQFPSSPTQTINNFAHTSVGEITCSAPGESAFDGKYRQFSFTRQGSIAHAWDSLKCPWLGTIADTPWSTLSASNSGWVGVQPGFPLRLIPDTWPQSELQSRIFRDSLNSMNVSGVESYTPKAGHPIPPDLIANTRTSWAGNKRNGDMVVEIVVNIHHTSRKDPDPANWRILSFSVICNMAWLAWRPHMTFFVTAERSQFVYDHLNTFAVPPRPDPSFPIPEDQVGIVTLNGEFFAWVLKDVTWIMGKIINSSPETGGFTDQRWMGDTDQYVYAGSYDQLVEPFDIIQTWQGSVRVDD